MYPFSAVRSKTTVKIAGVPLILYNIRTLIALGCETVIVVTRNAYAREISALVSGLPCVRVVTDDAGIGTADSLLAGAAFLGESGCCVALYGDTILGRSDLEALWTADGGTALVNRLSESPLNWIGAEVLGGRVTHIGAHERGGRVTHGFAGFSLTQACIRALRDTSEYFPNVKVGVGVPRERFLEAGLVPVAEGGALSALVCGEPFFDIDKPWHMLAANHCMVEQSCAALCENRLGDGAELSPDADIAGFVQLGKNARIGRGVTIKGSLIAGDGTVIENGAAFEGSAVIGGGTSIRNFCKIANGVSIGSNCIVDHCAEILGGMLMDKVYFCHYGEFYGAAGSYTDLGAGTVCGTLRFDDGETPHMVLGRREVPPFFANACYLGDYCRTGVGAMLMPGTTVGPYSVIGPGVLLARDLPERSLLRLKQEQVVTDWGEARYGW
jgi:bifunctional UDP-N-acetylglucosamine pyrophosphorylase/glucosamine-1-phosphate N-acetyltransferase